MRLPRFVAEKLAAPLESVPADPDALVVTAGARTPLRNLNFRRRVWQPALQAAGHRSAAWLPALRHLVLIRQGASVKAALQQLGHNTPMVTLKVYAHLFEDDLDRLYEALDASHSERQMASRRPGPAPAHRGGRTSGSRNRDLTCRNARRARRDSNPRPSD